MIMIDGTEWKAKRAKKNRAATRRRLTIAVDFYLPGDGGRSGRSVARSAYLDVYGDGPSKKSATETMKASRGEAGR